MIEQAKANVVWKIVTRQVRKNSNESAEPSVMGDEFQINFSEHLRQYCERLRFNDETFPTKISVWSDIVALLANVDGTQARQNPGMVYVDSDTELEEVFGAIAANTHITKLSLMQLRYDGDAKRFAKCWCDALACHPSLVNVVARLPKPASADTGSLLRSLATNTVMKDISIRYGNVEAEGAQGFVDGFTANKTIEVLRLAFMDGWCDEACRLVGDAIPNTNLKSIEFYRCDLGDGASSIAAGLGGSNTLERISFQESMNDNGLTALAASLRVNGSIRSIILSGSSFTAVGLSAIEESLRLVNCAVESFRLDQVDVFPERGNLDGLINRHCQKNRSFNEAIANLDSNNIHPTLWPLILERLGQETKREFLFRALRSKDGWYSLPGESSNDNAVEHQA